MAVARSVLTNAQALPVAAVFVAPNLPIPDNCISVALLNTSTTETALFGIGTPGGAAVAGTNCAPLLPGGAITLPIGGIAQRGPMDEGALTGSGICYAVTGAVAATVAIVYLNALNGAG
jgi:hypothetical protein